jgi:hypothetical protein
MKKRIITIVVAAAVLLTLSTASTADAIGLFGVSGSGVLVRHDDGYIITGPLRDADGQVVGTLHGTLSEQTTGFNSCPFTGTTSALCFPEPPGGWTCNQLGGDTTLNFRGTIYDAQVNGNANGHFASVLCKDTNDPTSYGLTIFMWSTSHVPPGEFPDIFLLNAGVHQISPTVFKWSS